MSQMPMIGGPPPGLVGPPPGLGGPPPGPPGPQGGGETQALEHLKAAMEHLQLYARSEPDEEDKAAALKFLAGLQQLLAKDQKENEAAMGTTPAQKVLMRMQGGGGMPGGMG